MGVGFLWEGLTLDCNGRITIDKRPSFIIFSIILEISLILAIIPRISLIIEM
jgi:hypothetical protein